MNKRLKDLMKENSMSMMDEEVKKEFERMEKKHQERSKEISEITGCDDMEKCERAVAYLTMDIMMDLLKEQIKMEG